MAFTLVNNQTIIARNASALYSVQVGTEDMKAYVLQAGANPDALLNQVYVASVGAASVATVAKTIVADLGITGANAAVAESYVVAQLNPVPVATRGAAINQILNLFSGLSDDPTWGVYATAWNAKVASAVAYAAVPGNATGPNTGSTFTLTTGADNLPGSAGDDLFTARIIDNANTLQSGDVIKGGAGNDTLSADVGNSQNFAITAETTGIEKVAIRAQAVSRDSTDNNTSITNEVQIDAQRMSGVTWWESTNSRADVLIEDVRILPAQITKDITIAMVETDPGHVDYGVYFDQYSLRAQTNSSSTLRLQLLDTRSALVNGAPLKDNPYWGFSFKLDGVTQTVTSPAIDAAQTYPELLTAISNAIKLIPALAKFTVALGNTFSAADTLSGQNVTGTEVVLTNNGPGVVSIDGTTGWQTQNGVVPSSSGLHTNVSTTATSNTDKVTSTIVLDDVGRGSTGGDLVVGGLSVGDTSTSRGVERFEIEVRDNSKLQTINSTNNTLQEVTIKNGVTSSDSFAYVATVKDTGNLTVLGEVLAGNNVSGGSFIDAALPGTETVNGGDQHNGFGFSDVRLIDASVMLGNFTFNAEVTERSIAKYMNLVDTQPNPAPDTNNAFGAIANFDYKGGAGNDSMDVQINPEVAGSRSRIISGREDFTFNIDGGAGDDKITVKMTNGEVGGNQNWYNNQDLNNNFTVNGGTGNDTIRTPGAGDMKIDGGAGSDTFYTDNTGFQPIVTNGAVGYPGSPIAPTTSNVNGQWVFNTTDQTATGTAARNINDLRSDTNELYNLHLGKLTVTFKGIPTATPVTIASTNYTTSDLQYNQAIKAAINNDAVLSKLLVAEDGPANSLIVKSMIDGVMTPADLSITVTAPTAGQLTVTNIAEAGAKYGLIAPTEATVLAAMANATTAAGTTFTVNGDYFTQLATDGVAAISGAASITTSDNLVLPGTDNDVIVLGTTVGANAGLSSNETVVYGAAFGNDTIVNFAQIGAGVDHLDFTALGGTAFTAAFTTDKSVNVQLLDASLSTAKATIEGLYNTNNTVAQTHVYVAVSAGNVGSVYSIADAVGANNAVATFQGAIDLANTSWLAGMTAANFVTNSGSAAYSLLDGPSVVAPVVLPTYALTSTATNVNEGATVTFNLATTNVANNTLLPYTITGVQAADVTGGVLTGNLLVTNNAASLPVSFVNDVLTEGAETATLTLTGLATASSVLVNDTSLTVVNGNIVLAAGSSAAVAATAGNDTFVFDVAAAKALTANTQINVTGFATGFDKLQIDSATALGNVFLSALNTVDGISVTSNAITNNTLINFGADANGDVITITLAGVVDQALVQISVI